MPGNAEERFQQHEEILRSLTAILVKQDGINDRLPFAIERVGYSIERIDHSIEHIGHSIERLDHSIERIGHSIERIETLLVRMFRPQENGRDA